MKFYDQVTITIQSGKGGDGSAAGRREAKIPWGGPAGGDGGKGGSIIFRASKDEWTLMPYRYKKLFTAKVGNPGMSKDKYGADADDIELVVPVGTLIKDPISGNIVAHLHEDGQTRVGAKGGKGGMGNIHFKNPQNQFPTMALGGEPGEKKELILELQLLADVALIGTPSVGKSTLINAVSGVKAKTAEYHFTTLVPNIGVVDHKGRSFTMIDVPGLIEGAGSGKGLGNEFLRHILKARIFAIFADASKDIPGMTEPALLIEEIMTYVDQRVRGSRERGHILENIDQQLIVEEGKLRYRVTTEINGKTITLLQKLIIFIVNKIDTLPDDELRKEYVSVLHEHILKYLAEKKVPKSLDLDEQTISLSALTREGTDILLDKLITLLQGTHFQTIGDQEIMQAQDGEIVSSIHNITAEESDMLVERGYIKEKQIGKTQVRAVFDPQISFFTNVLPRGNDEAEMRYRDTLGKEDLLKRLTKEGAKKGDILKIISVYQGHPPMYVSWD